MKKSKLNDAVKTYKDKTRGALQLLFDNINSGQKKQLVKREEIKELFDKYGVEY